MWVPLVTHLFFWLLHVLYGVFNIRILSKFWDFAIIKLTLWDCISNSHQWFSRSLQLDSLDIPFSLGFFLLSKVTLSPDDIPVKPKVWNKIVFFNIWFLWSFNTQLMFEFQFIFTKVLLCCYDISVHTKIRNEIVSWDVFLLGSNSAQLVLELKFVFSKILLSCQDISVNS